MPAVRSWIPVRALFLAIGFVLLCKESLSGQGSCFGTTYTPYPGTTHQALAIRDPASQQTAIFDLEWGATLASLLYNGERIWGNSTGAMVQPAFYGGPPPDPYFYNPEQAGDNLDRGAIVFAAACNSTPLFFSMSASSDYNFGRSGYYTYNTFKGGALVSNMYTTPYMITTNARFVPNPYGPPAYYLELDQQITNIDPTENFLFGFELAGYAPYTFSRRVHFPDHCPTLGTACLASSTPAMVGGLFPDAGLTNGVSFGIRASTYYPSNGKVFIAQQPDDINQNQSSHLFTDAWLLPPGSTRSYKWYVMAGSFDSALRFLGVPGGRQPGLHTLTPCRILDTRNSTGPYGGPMLAAEVPRTVTLHGQCGVPVTAKAVAANLTVVTPSGIGFVRAYPANAIETMASALNYKTGVARANNAVLAVDQAGKVIVVSRQASTHLVLDVSGYFE